MIGVFVSMPPILPQNLPFKTKLINKPLIS
jgi:hypothetical protein